MFNARWFTLRMLTLNVLPYQPLVENNFQCIPKEILKQQNKTDGITFHLGDLISTVYPYVYR